MTTAFIHIGAHKTATTTIQAALGELRGPLVLTGGSFARVFRKKIAYGMFRELRDGAEPQQVFNRYAKRGRTVMRQFIPDTAPEKIIVSDEGLSGFIDLRPGGIYPFLALGGRLGLESIEAAQKYFIFSIRGLPDFVTSVYTQLVKEGRPDRFSDYISQVELRTLSWRGALEPALDVWRELGAEIIVVNYDAVRHDVFGAYSSIFRERLSAGRKEFFNPRLSAPAVELIRCANGIDLEREDRVHLMRDIRQRLATSRGYPAATFLNEDQISLLNDNYVADLAWIAEKGVTCVAA